MSELSEDEQDRAKKFGQPDARDRFIGSRYALRKILSEYLSVGLREIALDIGPHGKPKIVGQNCELRFNLSHSNEHALVAISRGTEVGVDIEKIRELRHFDGFVRRFLSSNEAIYLSGCSANTRYAEFFKIWTAKEAYLKTLGVGLVGELQNFDIIVTAGSICVVERNRSSSEYFASTLCVASGYAAAVVAESSNMIIRYFDWNADV